MLTKDKRIPPLCFDLSSFTKLPRYSTWILHESEAFIGKASKGDVVVFYFESLATQHMKASDSPAG